MSETTTTKPLFTAAELAVLTAARAIVEKVEREGRSRSWDARNEPGRWATPYDWGRVCMAASHAGDALFQLLNETNANDVQEIPDETLHADLDEIARRDIRITLRASLWRASP